MQKIRPRATGVPVSSSGEHNCMSMTASSKTPSPSRSPWKKDMCAEDALRPGGGDHLKEHPSLVFRRCDSPQQAQKATPRRAVRNPDI